MSQSSSFKESDVAMQRLKDLAATDPLRAKIIHAGGLSAILRQLRHKHLGLYAAQVLSDLLDHEDVRQAVCKKKLGSSLVKIFQKWLAQGYVDEDVGISVFKKLMEHNFLRALVIEGGLTGVFSTLLLGKDDEISRRCLSYIAVVSNHPDLLNALSDRQIIKHVLQTVIGLEGTQHKNSAEALKSLANNSDLLIEIMQEREVLLTALLDNDPRRVLGACNTLLALSNHTVVCTMVRNSDSYRKLASNAQRARIDDTDERTRAHEAIEHMLYKMGPRGRFTSLLTSGFQNGAYMTHLIIQMISLFFGFWIPMYSINSDTDKRRSRSS
ncbi:hypothetical protein HYDPIDRAFT_116609 [Hydnomerulius pinastri MD-312]|uniref:Uncharacterized protein n=1 Tax=Hydnomerulius pinastri MD-312 TaxID=994086 RepID=A0A0C9WBL1_9AGAM|nr:hypothetical protein HYDPIDRAFT_116609 [Hydnomerulius pinastri MD-312]